MDRGHPIFRGIGFCGKEAANIVILLNFWSSNLAVLFVQSVTRIL